MKTHYDVLGVPFGADYETIKAAYRTALKAYHPDLNEGEPTAEMISKRIIDAHAVLKDPAKRALYDQQLLHRKLQRRRMFLITMLLTGVVVFGSSFVALQMSLYPRDVTVSELGQPPSQDLLEPDEVAERSVHQPTSNRREIAPAETRPASATARNSDQPSAVEPHSAPGGLLAATEGRPAPAASAALAPITKEGAPASAPKQELAQREMPLRQPEIKTANAPGRTWQSPAGIPVQHGPSTALASLPVSTPEPGRKTEASPRADDPPQPQPAQQAWDEVRQRGNVAEIVRFVQDHWGTPQAELAEQWLQDLIETTEDVSRLEALRAEATGTLALKAQFRIERLAAQNVIITAALPETEEAELPVPQAAQPAAALAVQPEPGQVQADAPNPTAGITPRDPKKHVRRALSLLKKGQHDEAIRSFDKAILLEPGNAKTHAQRASAWEAKGDLDKALSDYNTAIDLDHTSIPAFHARGMLWHRRGEFEKALIDLDRAIRLSFSDAKVYRDRGTVWYDMGRYNRAIADFSRAITINPNLASAYVSRGKAFKKKGDPLTATINFEKAVQRDPSIGKARDLLQARSD